MAVEGAAITRLARISLATHQISGAANFNGLGSHCFGRTSVKIYKKYGLPG
jgi:hypothetical protein